MLNCSKLGENYKVAEVAFCKACCGVDISAYELGAILIACYSIRRMQAA